MQSEPKHEGLYGHCFRDVSGLVLGAGYREKCQSFFLKK